jgi:hypothetical protein
LKDIPLHDKISFVSMIAMGVGAFVLLGREARPFLAAVFALLLLYGFGIAAPYLTHSSVVLNLHLLRDSTLLQLLAVLGSLSLAVRWWSSDNKIFAKLLGPVLVLVLCLPIRMTTVQPALHFTLACGLLALSVSPYWLRRLPIWLLSDRLRLRYAAIILIVAGFAVVVSSNIISNANAEAWIAEWDAAGRWARTGTPPNATFLIPTWYFRGGIGRTQPGSLEDEAVLNSGIFQYSAQRRLWIDFRSGAAIMWSPSYYDEWHRRVAEVNQLTTRSAETAYAKKNGINYIIDVCSAGSHGLQVFSTQRLCVFKTLYAGDLVRHNVQF